VDPLTPNAQFCDHGPQYRTVIFYGNEEEKGQADTSKQAIKQSGRFKEPIVTQIERASQFYPAEDYNQDFAMRNPGHYNRYKSLCGRMNPDVTDTTPATFSKANSIDQKQPPANTAFACSAARLALPAAATVSTSSSIETHRE
jgi:hypothetical protein